MVNISGINRDNTESWRMADTAVDVELYQY